MALHSGQFAPGMSDSSLEIDLPTSVFSTSRTTAGSIASFMERSTRRSLLNLVARSNCFWLMSSAHWRPSSSLGKEGLSELYEAESASTVCAVWVS